MDFITQLPKTRRGHDALLVVVDLYSKRAHLIPTTTDASAPETAQLFFDGVFKHHGLPLKIVSDRDSKFTSKFWKGLMRLLGTKLAMSTAFHPQTDGQTERMNKVVEEMLRTVVESRPRDWEEYLPAVEFAYNNSVHRSTGFTPFELDCGQHPVDPHFYLTHALKRSDVQSVEDFTSAWRAMLDLAHEKLVMAKAEQERMYGKQKEERHALQGR